MICPVCLGSSTAKFAHIDEKIYWRCEDCQARFLDPVQRLSPGDEHAHYLHHENNVDDTSYQKFLQKAATPLLEKLAPHCHGLDYGCGPGPALAHMLTQSGHKVRLYDPYFYNNIEALGDRYDFITCTETAEHFFHPANEFERFNKILKPGGWLVVMTCFQSDDAKFTNWYYRQDPTHVVFYRHETFQWLANHHNWSCEFPVTNVVLMQKIPARMPPNCPSDET
ncbi:MAG: class I SAM-dependent methyltransferase [Rhizobiaceae bacterium]|nr:class I SAM-dependent methyltransferase [Rhizobiaceae bacterium]